MTSAPRVPRGLSLVLVTALATGLITLALGATSIVPASAAARISVTNDRGSSSADVRYQTKLTIKGAGFQAVQGGFGGVYVLFGWVDDPRGNSWRPSRGGVTGTDYRYIPDAESGANQGYLRYVAFPGSSTAGEAHGTLSKSGGFQVQLTVPGPTFQSVDRAGKISTVDCRKVTCGVITIGAHGVKSPANESFTPVRFSDLYDAAPDSAPDTATEQPDGSTPAPGQGETAAPETTDSPDDAPAPGTAPAAPGGPAKVITDRTTAQAGHTLAFTATGFTPGEQVIGVLDDGVAGIGPMIAGPSGELAGILPLPADLEAGTHELRLTGAASGTAASERFPVRAPAAADSAAPSGEDTDDSDQGIRGSRLFLLIAGAVFVLALLGLAFRLLRRQRRTASSRPQATQPPTTGAVG